MGAVLTRVAVEWIAWLWGGPDVYRSLSPKKQGMVRVWGMRHTVPDLARQSILPQARPLFYFWTLGSGPGWVVTRGDDCSCRQVRLLGDTGAAVCEPLPGYGLFATSSSEGSNGSPSQQVRELESPGRALTAHLPPVRLPGVR